VLDDSLLERLLICYLPRPALGSPVQDTEEVAPTFDAYRDVRILLHTRQNRVLPQQLQFRNLLSVQQSNFNRNRPLRVLVHGWWEDDTSDINAATAAELLEYNDFNVSAARDQLK
jgi:Lipase